MSTQQTSMWSCYMKYTSKIVLAGIMSLFDREKLSFDGKKMFDTFYNLFFLNKQRAYFVSFDWCPLLHLDLRMDDKIIFYIIHTIIFLFINIYKDHGYTIICILILIHLPYSLQLLLLLPLSSSFLFSSFPHLYYSFSSSSSQFTFFP